MPAYCAELEKGVFLIEHSFNVKCRQERNNKMRPFDREAS